MPRILVVDDEPLISMLVEDWLLELDLEIVGPANSVTSALAIVEANPEIDGAILDLSLGNENSYPIAERLRQRQIPYAFVTGHDSGTISSAYRDALILTKPLIFEDIKKVVRKLLDSRAISGGARSAANDSEGV